MSLLGMESFDIYGSGDITKYWVSTGLGSIVPGAGRCGSSAWHGTAADGSGPAQGVAATTPSGFASFAYNPDSFNTLPNWSVYNSAGNNVCFIVAGLDGRIQGWAGINTILGHIVCQTPPNLVHLGLYTQIGVEWLISTSGYLRIYINGQLQANSGIVDMTQFFNFGNNQWTGISWTPEGYVDDLYWGDTNASNPLNVYAAFLGDAHVEGQNCLTDAVGGGGTFEEMTPSGGTDHGALLDSNPIDLTKYVTSSTLGARETVRFGNVIPTTGTIFAIQMMPAVVKNTFANRNIANIVYNASTLTQGTDFAVAQTNPRYYPQLFAKNPTTNTNWTIATTNATQNGIIITL